MTAKARRHEGTRARRELAIGHRWARSLTVAAARMGLAAAALAMCGSAWGQQMSGGGYQIPRSGVVGGAGTMTAGEFSLTGVACASIGGVASGGDFEARGGTITSCGQCQLYGDVFPLEGDCVIDLDDILCVLDDFGNPNNCAGDADVAPCGGNNIIDLDDILNVLDAFRANYACAHPCPPAS